MQIFALLTALIIYISMTNEGCFHFLTTSLRPLDPRRQLLIGRMEENIQTILNQSRSRNLSNLWLRQSRQVKFTSVVFIHMFTCHFSFICYESRN